MVSYNTIYEYTSNVSGIEFDRRIMAIVEAINKRYNTVIGNLYRANFSELEKKAIINMIKNAGHDIPNEDIFFVKENGVSVSVSVKKNT